MSFQPTAYTTYIVSPPEEVWAALTTPEQTQKYFFGRRIESDWQVGSTWNLLMEDGRLDVTGKVLKCDRPRLLSLSWRVEWLEELRGLPDTVVTYRLEPFTGFTRLTMTEDHPEPIPEKYLDGGRRGWPLILSGLKSLLETGKPLPKFDMAAVMA